MLRATAEIRLRFISRPHRIRSEAARAGHTFTPCRTEPTTTRTKGREEASLRARSRAAHSSHFPPWCVPPNCSCSSLEPAASSPPAPPPCNASTDGSAPAGKPSGRAGGQLGGLEQRGLAHLVRRVHLGARHQESLDDCEVVAPAGVQSGVSARRRASQICP